MMESHEYADLFPLATGDELREMADDIRQRGLLCPIVTLGGRILDGRNRARACEMAGVAPHYREYDGDDPLADVVSWNLKRRQMTTSQRAALGVTLKPMFAERARERMAEGGKRHGEGVANLPQVESAKARDQAAAAVGVSGRSVQDAEYVQQHAPEVFEQIKTGEKKVHAAKKEVQKRERKAIQDPLDTGPSVAETEVEKDEDSGTLYHLKRYWQRATKRDKHAFREWINANCG